MKIKRIAFLLILILISYNGIYADQNDQPQVTLHGSTITYEGILNEKGFNKIKSAFLKANRDVKWLYINSPGGEINISMDIGFWVFQNHLNIRLQEKCLSSCANYLLRQEKIRL